MVVDRLLVKVSDYVERDYYCLCPTVLQYHTSQRLLKELWDPLRAALDGTLTGRGTLATVLLCKSMLSYLPTGFEVDQPRWLLKAYDVMPVRSSTSDLHRIDLRQHATTKRGILYIHQLKKSGALPPSARQCARQLLDFLRAMVVE